MVAFVKLCDEGLVVLEGSFLGGHTFPAMFCKTGSGCSEPRILTEDTIESTVGTILALSTRTVKRYVLAASGLDKYSLRIKSRKSIVDCRSF